MNMHNFILFTSTDLPLSQVLNFVIPVGVFFWLENKNIVFVFQVWPISNIQVDRYKWYDKKKGVLYNLIVDVCIHIKQYYDIDLHIIITIIFQISTECRATIQHYEWHNNRTLKMFL